MTKKGIQFCSVCMLIVFVSLSFFSFSPEKAEASTRPLQGHGWSDTIGWMSLSGQTPEYAVTTTVVSPTRINLRGYAWTSTLGWISFEESAVSGCAAENILSIQSGTTDCAPYIDMTGSGPYRIRGFARACSVFVSGCSGEIKTSAHRGPYGEIGDWNGYISLNSGNGAWGWRLEADRTTITGYAWGDKVVGWLDINATCDGCAAQALAGTFSSNGCVATPPYSPTLSWTTVPRAQTCTLRNLQNGAQTLVQTEETNYVVNHPGFTIPEVGMGEFILECSSGGPATRIGDPVRVTRCGLPALCPDGTVRPPSGICTTCPSGSPFPCPLTDYCPAPNSGELKSNVAGTNCFCSDGTTLKIDPAGTNCGGGGGGGNRPRIREI